MLVPMQKNNQKLRVNFQLFMNRSTKNEVRKCRISRVKMVKLLSDWWKLLTSVYRIVLHGVHNRAFFFLAWAFLPKEMKIFILEEFSDLNVRNELRRSEK